MRRFPAAAAGLVLLAACSSPSALSDGSPSAGPAAEQGSARVVPDRFDTIAPVTGVTPLPDEPVPSPVPVDSSQVPSWVGAGAARMRDGVTCTTPGTAPSTVLSAITSTSAVHFAGCISDDGELASGVSVYMQPDPGECGWSFQYQVVCGDPAVTLVWQADSSRGFVPDLRGVVSVSVPDFVLSGTVAGSPARYRYFGGTHLGFSVIDAS